MIQQVLFLEDDHGIPCTLSTYENNGGKPEVYENFSGTVGEFLELIQRICQGAAREELREYIQNLIDRGIPVPCPVCDEVLCDKDDVTGKELAEDALMCVNCRHS